MGSGVPATDGFTTGFTGVDEGLGTVPGIGTTGLGGVTSLVWALLGWMGCPAIPGPLISRPASKSRLEEGVDLCVGGVCFVG